MSLLVINKILQVILHFLTAECIAGKFYSRHDVVRREAADQNFVDMIELESAKGPKDRSEHPASENQR